LDHLALSPASASISSGGSQAYTAQGRDQYDNSLGDMTAATTFSIAPNGSCIDHIVISPATATIAAGGSQAYTAEGFDAANNSLGDVTAATTFSIGPNGSCTGATCTATVSGAHTVTGNDGGKTATASLNVTVGPLDHL